MSDAPLYVVIPAYNECDNIKQVVSDWYPIVEKYSAEGRSRLVVIDDGSKDNTYEILQRIAVDKPLLMPVTKKNGGHGASVLFGYKLALESGAAYVFQTDSDGQTMPQEFDDFWRQREEYDMLIGWRSHRMDGLSRVFVTKVLKLVIRFCFGVWITDANTPYRLLKAETLRKFIDLIPDGYNLSNVLLSVIYTKKKQKVKFIPITFRQRQGGVNSINFRKIISIGWKAVQDFQFIKKTLK